MKRALLFVATVALVAACTENLTTPGTCPTFCPGGQAVFRDTILTPIPNGDSSFTGYLEPSSLISVLASSGGAYGQNIGVIRFLAVTDSILVSDTLRPFSIDSIGLDIGLQAIDTTVGGFVLEIYRLPRTIDSTASFATIQALMTPANKITELPEPVSYRSGVATLIFAGDTLSRFTFLPSDSTVLELGFRVRADSATAARIGTPASGSFAPLFTTYVHALQVPDSLAIQSKAVIADEYFTAKPPSTQGPSTTLLAVGGIPVARSFLRFALPPYLHDSATIIRATLHLTTDSAVIGIPADTATLVASALVADFGAKSPPLAGTAASTPLLPGATAADLEVASLVQLWQGKTGLPSILRISLGQEGGTFTFPMFRSTRSASGGPTLRITYRPPFAFEGY